MKFTLRPYQKEAVDRAVNFFRKDQIFHAIEILPTGSGKSLIIANIVKELNAKTLVLQPSKEILEQNYIKMVSYGYYATIFSASAGQKKVSDITFATIGSIIKKTDLFQEFKYIIIDECHLVNADGGMYSEFIQKIERSKVLGLTATPYRLSSDGFGGSILKFITRTRPRIFSEVVYYIQNRKLFDEGFLAKLKYYDLKAFDRSKLQLNSTGADYTDKSVQNYFKATGFLDRLVRVVKRLIEINRKNILVFTRFIEESQYVVSNIPGSAIVTGQTPKNERERILSDFKRGRIKVVCNVGVLTTGFDYPELETIVLARPTMSLSLYYQMVGRGIRPHPGKEYAMIVDMCGNIELFGEIEDLHINEDRGGKWFISTNKKQLTNVYFTREKADSIKAIAI